MNLQAWRAFVAGWGNALWAASYASIGYLALEPHVRRKWPNALIPWTRLLAGRFSDRLVGEHILRGFLFGTAGLAVAAAMISQTSRIETPYWYAVSTSPVHFAETLLATIPQTAIETTGVFSVLFVAIVVVRKRWLAASLTAFVLTAVASVGAPPSIWLRVVVLLLFISLVVFALRFGLLALAAAMFVKTVVTWFPLTLDASAFYFGPSLAVVLLVIGLAAWAYRNVVRSRGIYTL